MAVWPGSRGVHLRQVHDLGRGDAVNEHDVTLNLHAGTHIDAPRHFLAGAACVDELPLEAMLGPATVIALPDVAEVTAVVLEAAAVPTQTRRLLLQTRNSRRLPGAAFDTGYVALSADGAEWIVRRGITLVGIDYLSIERFGASGDVHRTLLQAGVVVVEGLKLCGVSPGDYWLSCVPLRLVGAEAAPVRAVLTRLQEGGAL
jgi:arylformamidase